MKDNLGYGLDSSERTGGNPSGNKGVEVLSNGKNDMNMPKHAKNDKYEAIITCIDYSDYLAETLPYNKMIFDRILVVTSESDRETLELCRKLSVDCYATDCFYHKDEVFNKARGINFGMKYLRYHSWVACMDADTLLCPSAGWWLRHKDLDYGKIYGCDRVNCQGYTRWKKWKEEFHSGYDYQCRVHFPEGMQILDRISLDLDGGYAPIGFFQLWHSSSRRKYPVHDGFFADAERSDVAHSTQWNEEDRILLGEFYAIHLSPEKPVELGTNWRGRNYEASPRFEKGV